LAKIIFQGKRITAVKKALGHMVEFVNVCIFKWQSTHRDELILEFTDIDNQILPSWVRVNLAECGWVFESVSLTEDGKLYVSFEYA